jgi:hypothetical protein
MARIHSFFIILSLLLSFSWSTSADMIRTSRHSNLHLLDKLEEKGSKSLANGAPKDLCDDSVAKRKSASLKNYNSSVSKDLGNSTSISNSSSSDSSSKGTATSSAASPTRSRICDQGDISLASGLSTFTVVSLGIQASVKTLSDLVTGNGSSSDIKDATTRLSQFLSSKSPIFNV